MTFGYPRPRTLKALLEQVDTEISNLEYSKAEENLTEFGCGELYGFKELRPFIALAVKRQEKWEPA